MRRCSTALVEQAQLQAADFSVVMSSSSVTILQGGVSVPVNFSIVPRNGFSGSVQVSFTGLPVGVSSNPPSPFTITSGIQTAVNFGADAAASTGSFTLSAQAVSGALSDSASLTLAIQASCCCISSCKLRSNGFYAAGGQSFRRSTSSPHRGTTRRTNTYSSPTRQ